MRNSVLVVNPCGVAPTRRAQVEGTTKDTRGGRPPAGIDAAARSHARNHHHPFGSYSNIRHAPGERRTARNSGRPAAHSTGPSRATGPTPRPFPTTEIQRRTCIRSDANKRIDEPSPRTVPTRNELVDSRSANDGRKGLKPQHARLRPGRTDQATPHNLENERNLRAEHF